MIERQTDESYKDVLSYFRGDTIINSTTWLETQNNIKMKGEAESVRNFVY